MKKIKLKMILIIMLIQSMTLYAVEHVSVLVAYTADARQYVEENQILFDYNKIDYILKKALAEMNLALTNSGITSFSMSFAKTPFEVTWVELNNSGSEIVRMRNDEASLVTLRDQYKADIVFLAVRKLVGSSGAGFCPGILTHYQNLKREKSLPESVGKGEHAFSVGDIEAIAGIYPSNRYLLAHEIGHNLGLLHDETTCIDQSITMGITLDEYLLGRSASYAHGYHDQHQPCLWHTIMSYPQDGSARILYYSNPDLTPDDANKDKIGVTDESKTISANAAKLLQENAAVYASWRTECTGNTCNKQCIPDVSNANGYRCVDCINNSHCSAGESCIDGKCVHVSACDNATCEPNQICKEDANSPNGYKCIDYPCATCPDKCTLDNTTPSGWKCADCLYDGHCPEGYVCVNKICVLKQQHCSPSPCPASTPYCSEINVAPYYRCEECRGSNDCPPGTICSVKNYVSHCVPSVTCTQSASISYTAPKGINYYTIMWGNGESEDVSSITKGTKTWKHSYTVTHALGSPINYKITLIVKGGNGAELASKNISINCGTALPTPTVTATPTAGVAPIAVVFSLKNTGGPITIYNWDFGDGGVSNETNPTHTYKIAGQYTVQLSVTGPGGTSTVSKPNYITITAVAPVIDFQANKTLGTAPLAISFVTTNTGGPVYNWYWDFGDGNVSTEQNPVHIYKKRGLFTVILKASGPNLTNTKTKEGYIQVNSNITPILQLLLTD